MNSNVQLFDPTLQSNKETARRKKKPNTVLVLASARKLARAFSLTHINAVTNSRS